MAKEKLVVIKEAEISNNCPECFNQDMKLSFFQRHLHSRFYHRITSAVSHQILCQKCQSIIYPVKWTEDIERIFDYYQKTVEPAKTGTKFTALFYIVILVLIIINGALVYLYMEGMIKV